MALCQTIGYYSIKEEVEEQDNMKRAFIYIRIFLLTIITPIMIALVFAFFSIFLGTLFFLCKMMMNNLVAFLESGSISLWLINLSNGIISFFNSESVRYVLDVVFKIALFILAQQIVFIFFKKLQNNKSNKSE